MTLIPHTHNADMNVWQHITVVQGNTTHLKNNQTFLSIHRCTHYVYTNTQGHHMTCTIHALLCVNMYTHMCILYLQVYSRYNMQLDTSISACPNRDTGLYFFPEVLTRPLFKPSFYLGLASIKSDWNLMNK